MFAFMYNWFFAACAGSSNSLLDFPTWYKYLPDDPTAPGTCSPTIDLTQPNQVASIILALIEIMLRISALVAVGFIIYGGFRFILSQGNADNSSSARKTIINSLIGLVIALLATAIVSLVASSLS